MRKSPQRPPSPTLVVCLGWRAFSCSGSWKRRCWSSSRPTSSRWLRGRCKRSLGTLCGSPCYPKPSKLRWTTRSLACRPTEKIPSSSCSNMPEAARSSPSRWWRTWHQSSVKNGSRTPGSFWSKKRTKRSKSPWSESSLWRHPCRLALLIRPILEATFFIAVWSAEDAGRRPSRTTSTRHDLPVVQDESEDQTNWDVCGWNAAKPGGEGSIHPLSILRLAWSGTCRFSSIFIPVSLARSEFLRSLLFSFNMVDRTAYADDAHTPKIALRQIFGRMGLSTDLCRASADVGLLSVEVFAMLSDAAGPVRTSLQTLLPTGALGRMPLHKSSLWCN